MTDSHESPRSYSRNSGTSRAAGQGLLDLSFRSILSLQDIGDEIGKPNSTGLKKSKESGKLICTALRLNNNNIADLEDLGTVLEEIFHDPTSIEWIDLSFNDLHSVSGLIDTLTNLKVLYLHANAIEKLQEIDKLTTLGDLKSLTMHGNPVESCDGYRQHILSTLPSLKTLDFSGVTKQDRTVAETWRKSNPKRNSKGKKSH